MRRIAVKCQQISRNPIPAAKTSLRSNDCVKMQAQSRIAPGFASNDCGKMLAP
jgi:hypothetical protein